MNFIPEQSISFINKFFKQKTQNTRLLIIQLALGLILSKNPSCKKYYQNYIFFAITFGKLMTYVIENETVTIPSYRKFLMGMILDKECQANKIIINNVKDCSVLHSPKNTCLDSGIATFNRVFISLLKLYLQLNIATIVLSLPYSFSSLKKEIPKAGVQTLRSTLFVSIMIMMVRLGACFVIGEYSKHDRLPHDQLKSWIHLMLLLCSPVYFIETQSRRNIINGLMLNYTSDMLLDMSGVPKKNNSYYVLIGFLVSIYLYKKKFGHLARALVF